MRAKVVILVLALVLCGTVQAQDAPKPLPLATLIQLAKEDLATRAKELQNSEAYRNFERSKKIYEGLQALAKDQP